MQGDGDMDRRLPFDYPQPDHPPNFADHGLRLKIEQIVSSLTDAEMHDTLDYCLDYKEGLLLEVCRIYWSLWHFGLDHGDALYCLNNKYVDLGYVEHPLKGGDKCHWRLYTRHFDAVDGTVLLLRKDLRRAQKESMRLLPMALRNATEIPTRRRLLRSLLSLLFHDKVATQHGGGTKVAGRLIREFVESYRNARVSSHYNAADCLLQRSRSQEDKRKTATAISLQNGSTSEELYVEIQGVPVDIVHWYELSQWFYDSGIEDVFKHMNRNLEEASMQLLLDATSSLLRSRETPEPSGDNGMAPRLATPRTTRRNARDGRAIVAGSVRNSTLSVDVSDADTTDDMVLRRSERSRSGLAPPTVRLPRGSRSRERG
jgi:hypothetical protein